LLTALAQSLEQAARGAQRLRGNASGGAAPLQWPGSWDNASGYLLPLTLWQRSLRTAFVRQGEQCRGATPLQW